MRTKPKVLIMIAAGEISGPGKGVFQFLEHAPAGAFEYVLCNFDVRQRPAGQFIEEALRRKLNLRLLRQRMPLDPALITQALSVIREHDINVIQTHGYKSNAIGFVLRMLCRCPWIGFAHGYIDDNRRNRIYNRVDRLVLRKADRVVAVSGSMKALLARHGVPEGKISVVHNAIDPKAAVPGASRDEVLRRHGLAPDDLVVGVIGRLNPEKGQMIFLRAMEKAARAAPGVKALIIGDGQDRPALENFCRETGLAGRVLFLGYQDKVADYYQILDLLVLPSLSEGLPNTILEAMSFGIPVLASEVGGVPEVIENGNGVMVPPGDAEALAAGMIKLLGDRALRQAIGSKGRQSLVPRFAAAGRAQRIAGLYEELLAGPAAAQMTRHTEW